jgi:hypothetical protein
VHRGEEEREAGEVPHELAEKGAAYAGVGDRQARQRRSDDEPEPGEDQPAAVEPEEEGGAD